MEDIIDKSNEFKGLVTLLISSTNIRDPIELCIKSIFKHTKVPFELIVLDSSDNYKRIKFLEKLHHSGKIKLLKETEKLLKHDQALNKMLKYVNTKYFVTLDSDIEILKEGWLSLMLKNIENTNADLICAKEFQVSKEITEDQEYSAPDNLKFAIWMTLYRTQPVKKMKDPFKYRKEVVGKTPEGRKKIICYDTGIELFYKLRQRRKTREVNELNSYFTHYRSIAIFINKTGYFKYYFGGIRNVRRRARKYKDYLRLVLRNRLYYGNTLGMFCWNLMKFFHSVNKLFK